MKFQYFSHPLFQAASRQACRGREEDPTVWVTAHISAPLLFSYAWWVIQNAQAKGIKRLYFLARDGYLLFHFAEMIRQSCGISIDNRYLYGSRLAWRVPSFHLIGEEAFDQIFLGGYRITPKVVLTRLGLSEEERLKICIQAGIPWEEDRILSMALYREFSQRLRAAPEFQRLVMEKSRLAYPAAMGYFQQEGLLDEIPYGLVDTGWTGSMQRTLRVLLESEGYKAPLTGFYFGMYERPKSKKDGAYLTWDFSRESPVLHRALFNNNVLECMCMCPHPMTVGYEKAGQRFLPVFRAGGQTDLPLPEFQKRRDVMIQFAQAILAENGLEALPFHELWNMTYRAMRRLSIWPTQREASAFQSFSFCDDVAESYLNSLISPITREEAKKYQLLRRLSQKAFRKDVHESADLFWPYGSLALSDFKGKGWYRWNMLAWDILRLMKSR